MKPTLAPDHKGMKVDYRGLLRQTRVALPIPAASDKIYMLEALQDHLTELGERFYAGDLTVVDEFLQLYCIAAEKRPGGVALAGGWGELREGSDFERTSGVPVTPPEQKGGA